MVCLFAMSWHKRQLHVVLRRPIPETPIIMIPDALAAKLYFRAFFELGTQICGENVGEAITRTDVDPTVFVYLSSEEAFAICTFIPYKFCSIKERFVVYDKCSAFATG